MFVGNTAWSMYNFRLEVLKFMAKEYNVIVLAPDDAWGIKLRSEGIAYKPITIDNNGMSPLKDIKLLLDLFKLYKQYKPSLIFHYTIKPNIYGTLAAVLCGRIKSIAVVTGAGSVFSKSTFLTRLVKTMFRLSFLFSSEVWFLNKDDQNLFISSKLVSRSKVVLLPSEGINTLEFENCYECTQSEKFSFLYLGRILWDKGIAEYVESARKIKEKNKNVVFKILGFFDDKNPSAVPAKFADRWKEEGIIEYLGSSDNVSDVILGSDCIVLPSKYKEGIPRSLLEAASLEKPIIATDIPGCRDIVDDNVTGYLCQPNSAVDLQDKMEKMLGLTHDQRALMGKAGRENIKKKFDICFILEQYRKSVLDLVPNSDERQELAHLTSD